MRHNSHKSQASALSASPEELSEAFLSSLQEPAHLACPVARFVSCCEAWRSAIARALAMEAQYARSSYVLASDLTAKANEFYTPRLDNCYADTLREFNDFPLIHDIKLAMDQALDALESMGRSVGMSVIKTNQWRQRTGLDTPYLVFRGKLDTALRQLQRYKLGQASPELITITVATKRYQVSRKTLQRELAKGRLTDHGKSGSAANSPRLVDENEVANRWLCKPN